MYLLKEVERRYFARVAIWVNYTPKKSVNIIDESTRAAPWMVIDKLKGV